MSAPQTPINVGVVGLGVMGAQHIESYRVASVTGAPNRLVAVCDADADRRAGVRNVAGALAVGEDATERLFDPGLVMAYETPAELFADGSVDLVSLCTYTDSHVALAIAALAAGCATTGQPSARMDASKVMAADAIVQINGLS